MKLNIIVPVYNEEECITKFHEVISEVLKEKSYEIIYVNDGSSDNSINKLKDIYNDDKKHVRIISFARNFGKDAAIYAGLKASDATYTCIIDSDLQQDPKYILQMYKFLEENEEYDAMCMIQAQAKSRLFQKLFYKTITKMSDIKFQDGASDFRMLRKYVVKSILELSENNRFSKGIFAWVGYKTYYAPYEVKERTTGKSKFNFKASMKYAIEGLVGFSTKPLRFSTIIGAFTSFAAFIYLIYIIIKTCITGVETPGYASTICVVLFLGGIQLLCMGILGEYLSKTYLETKNRPIYIAKERIGFDEDFL